MGQVMEMADQTKAGLKKTLVLRNGVCVPQVGYGTFESAAADVGRSVRWALETGYRHIDTAKAYGNEAEIGNVVAEGLVRREELFLVTKLWMTDYGDAQKAIEEALRRLKVEYLDLMMLHWPGTDKPLRYKAYEALLRAQHRGLIRAVGVANFMQDHLEDLAEQFGAYPLYNQIQVHPWGQQDALCAFCRARGIAVAAWGPLMRGYIREEKRLGEIAANYGCTPAQAVLRWHLQKGNILLPKSVHLQRIQENAEIFSFVLSQEDMRKIDSMEKDWHWGPDPYSFDG